MKNGIPLNALTMRFGQDSLLRCAASQAPRYADSEEPTDVKRSVDGHQ